MAQPANELDLQPRFSLPWPLRILLAGACIVVIVAGLKMVAPILSGFLFAMLLALVLFPVTRALIRWRVPRALAIVLTLLVVFLGGAALIFMVAGSIAELSGNLPAVQPALHGPQGSGVLVAGGLWGGHVEDAAARGPRPEGIDRAGDVHRADDHCRHRSQLFRPAHHRVHADRVHVPLPEPRYGHGSGRPYRRSSASAKWRATSRSTSASMRSWA